MLKFRFYSVNFRIDKMNVLDIVATQNHGVYGDSEALRVN